MQQLDDQLKRATANAVYWMKRYYNLRMRVDDIAQNPNNDAYKLTQLKYLLELEKHQDVLNDPNGGKAETPQKSAGKV